MKRIDMVGRVAGVCSTLALAVASTATLSAEFVLDSAGFAKGSNSTTVLVGFSGSSDITDSQVDATYDPSAVKVSVKSFGSAGCANPRPGLIRVISPDTNGKPLGEKMGAYCQITVSKLKSGSGSTGLSLANAFCSGVGGIEKPCLVATSEK